MRKILYYLIIICFSSYIALLFADNKLIYYIHPRYIFWSLFASIVAICVSFTGLVYEAVRVLKDKKVRSDLKNGIKLRALVSRNNTSLYLLVSVLAIGLLLPAKPLSSATATQRSLDINNVSLSTAVAQNLKNSSFSSITDTKNFSIQDWAFAINYNSNVEFFNGRDIEVTGFIFQPEENINDYFLVSRFFLTCCAVDVRPIGLKVKYDWRTAYKEDDWVLVKGKLQTAEIGGLNQVVIIPEILEKIAPPKDPYLYK